MKISILGFTVPDEVLAEINDSDPVLQTQTHRFAWGLVRAFGDNGAEVRLISAAPVSDFPHNPRAIWPLRRFEARGVPGLMLPFINVTGLKHVTRFLACWVFALRELRRARPDWLVVHGVHSPFLWFAVLAAPRARCKVAVVLTDPPGVISSEEGAVRSLLKRVDIGIVTRALRRSDAVVVLAEPLARDFAPSIRFLVMEGLFDAAALPEVPRAPATGVRRVVFAGGLREEYGVKRLVEAFHTLTDPDLRLELYGQGALGDWLAEQAAADDRIQPPRLVSPEELPEIYARADILVQPRQSEQGFVPYSFPSKLIEYMASGTPVVSTRLPSIPAEYEPHLIWSDGDEPGDLAAAMQRALDMPEEASGPFGARAASFIRTTRNTTAQGARIVEFLQVGITPASE
jgi:glycosyltransferase involved in cell wall biosynthesis